MFENVKPREIVKIILTGAASLGVGAISGAFVGSLPYKKFNFFTKAVVVVAGMAITGAVVDKVTTPYINETVDQVSEASNVLKNLILEWVKEHQETPDDNTEEIEEDEA